MATRTPCAHHCSPTCTTQATPLLHSHVPSPARLLRQRRRALTLKTPLGAGGGAAAALAQAVSAAGSSPELVMTTFFDGVPLGEPTCRRRAGSARGLTCRRVRGVGGGHGWRGSPSPPRTPRPGPPGLRQTRTELVSGVTRQIAHSAAPASCVNALHQALRGVNLDMSSYGGHLI